MPIFAVLLNEDSPQLNERLANLKPIKIGPAAYLVHSEDALSSEIALQAKIKGEERDLSGVVLVLDGAYSGWHRSETWEWLRRYSSQ